MIRPANEHEETAFRLVERTMRRMRPLVGARGLEAITLPHGMVERGSLGRLRVRFNGNSSDFEPENRPETRPLSDEEASWWADVRRMMELAKPVADPEWNLVSMRLGSRVLRRTRLGSLVTFLPDGTPPFVGSIRLRAVKALPASGRTSHSFSPIETALLSAIDAFYHEEYTIGGIRHRMATAWSPAKASSHQRFPGAYSSPTRFRRHPRGKWHRCPICRAPVVKGAYNPRIPYGTVKAGSGSIRDLRGGFMSRLRDTYIVEDPDSLLQSAGS